MEDEYDSTLPQVCIAHVKNKVILNHPKNQLRVILLHFFVALVSLGRGRRGGFWKYKRLYMEGLEANHGQTRQRDLHFLLSLFLVMGAGGCLMMFE